MPPENKLNSLNNKSEDGFKAFLLEHHHILFNDTNRLETDERYVKILEATYASGAEHGVKVAREAVAEFMSGSK